MQFFEILILTVIIVILIPIEPIQSEKINYTQNKYNITVERVETTYFNKDIYDYFDFKSGRTSRQQITIFGCAKVKVDINDMQANIYINYYL